MTRKEMAKVDAETVTQFETNIRAVMAQATDTELAEGQSDVIGMRVQPTAMLPLRPATCLINCRR